MRTLKTNEQIAINGGTIIAPHYAITKGVITAIKIQCVITGIVCLKIGDFFGRI